MNSPKKGKQTPVSKNKLSTKNAYTPTYLLAFFCAIAAFLLYVNTIKHDYALDDVGVIRENQFVQQGIKGIPKIMSIDMWHFDNMNLGYYRPLSLITFAIENEFFPNNPHISHLNNVLLYALTGFFLCLLLMRIFKTVSPFFSFLIVLLFLAHPIHTEVVANIKSRDELLSFLNLLIALLFFYKADESPKRRSLLLLGSLVFFYFALLSKETAMAGILLAPLVLYFKKDLNLKKSFLKSLPFLIVIVVFQYQKLKMLGSISGIMPKDIVNYPYAETGTKFPAVFLIFAQCIRMLVFPHPLSYDYSYNQLPVSGFAAAGVIAGLLCVIGLVYFMGKEFKKKSDLAFGILIFAVTLAPALAFVLLRGGIFAERFLYAPALGFSVALVSFIWHGLKLPDFNFAKTKQFFSAVAICGLIFSLYSFKTVMRNPAWHDNLTLFSTDVNSSTNSCQVHRHCGGELINLGMAESDPKRKLEWFEKGSFELKEALRINPHFGEALFKLGVAYQTVKLNNDSAIFYYSLAIREMPGYAVSYNNLGILYESTGKQELASYYYNKSVEVNPYFPDGVRNRDNHHKRTGLDIKNLPGGTIPFSK